MIKPKSFGFNKATSSSNSFQNEVKIENVSAKVKDEFIDMVNVLESNKVDLKVIEDKEDDLPDSIFPNNWISQIPNETLVVYSMFTENRRKEVRKDIINWAVKKLNISNFIDLTSQYKSLEYLEGTGSIVFDHDNKIAYACNSVRTSINLLSRLCNKIGYKTVFFESFGSDGMQVYHTNVMMSIGQKVVIVCLDSIHDLKERELLKNELYKSGKEIIEITYDQMNSFAANALEISSKDGEVFYVMSKTAVDVLEENQLNKIGNHSKIITIQIPTIEKIGGGSVRCMMAGFFNYPR